MTDDATTETQSVIERLTTGIPGLDEVLCGGLVRGDSYLAVGEPGTGKTTLGNHLAFHRAATGDVVLFVTVLAEAHDRMLLHLSDFAFFARELIGRNIHYLSLYDDLRQQGLDGGLAAFRRLVQQYRPRLLVIDGAGRLEDFAVSRADYRRATAELHAQLALLDCTGVLLAQPSADGDTLHTIGTHVDGIILLEDRTVGGHPARLLRVLKQRGGETLRGHHEFGIASAGIEVYPRLEAALVPARAARRGRQKRHPLGIAGLDPMLLGGVLTGASTLVAGPPGIGKTTVGLHFVAEGAHDGERALIAGFQEAPERLVAKADGLGLDLGRQVEAGRVRILWEPSPDRPLDAWAGALLAAVAEHRPQRLVIDALTDVARLATLPERLPAFANALVHALRAREVTTIFTAEMPTVEGAALDVPLPEVAAVLDNVVLLRYVEPRSRLHRLVSVLRVRESGFDAGVREFAVTDHGIEVATTTESAEAILADAPSTARLGGGGGGSDPFSDAG